MDVYLLCCITATNIKKVLNANCNWKIIFLNNQLKIIGISIRHVWSNKLRFPQSQRVIEVGMLGWTYHTQLATPVYTPSTFPKSSGDTSSLRHWDWTVVSKALTPSQTSLGLFPECQCDPGGCLYWGELLDFREMMGPQSREANGSTSLSETKWASLEWRSNRNLLICMGLWSSETH